MRDKTHPTQQLQRDPSVVQQFEWLDNLSVNWQLAVGRPFILSLIHQPVNVNVNVKKLEPYSTSFFVGRRARGNDARRMKRRGVKRGVHPHVRHILLIPALCLPFFSLSFSLPHLLCCIPYYPFPSPSPYSSLCLPLWFRDISCDAPRSRMQVPTIV